MYLIFYYSAMTLSLMASLCVLVLAWKHRRFPGALAMGVLAIATFVWTLGYLIEASSGTLEKQLLFNNVGYLGSMAVPVAWFIFARRYAGGAGALPRWEKVLLCIIPIVTVVLVWSNNQHHLMWSNERLVMTGPFLATAKTYEPLFWMALSYNYLLVTIGAVMLLRRLFIGTPLYTGQAVSLVVAVSLPLLWNVIYVFDLLSLPRKDLTPVMFTASGLAIVLGLLRFRLFKAVPFAHRFIVHQMNDGVIVFDAHNRLTELNPAAQRITGLSPNIIGESLAKLAPFSPVLERVSSTNLGRLELPLEVSDEKRFYELETMPMLDNRARRAGWMAVLHDVTERKQAEKDLQESESMYRLLSDNMADVIWISGLNMRLSFISPSVERLLGYTVEEAMAKKMEEVFTPEAIRTMANVLSEEMAIEKQSDKDLRRSRTLETQMIHRDGTIIPVEISYSALRDACGEIHSILCVARDISKRKQTEDRYQTIIHTAMDGFWLADMDGRFLDANEAYCLMVGYSLDELMRMTVFDIEALEKPDEIFRRIQKISDVGHDRFESCHRCKNGDVIDVEISVNYLPLESGRMFIFARDITERKRAEKALSIAYENEKELRRTLEEEAQKRLEFTRALVHELKTPLTPIVVTSELLLSELKEEPWARMARNIHQGADVLSQRIDELLDLARGELCLLTLNIDSISPLALLDDVVSEMAPVAAKRKQVLSAELPQALPHVQMDEERIRQVIQNLLNNACKFTGEGGNITLRAREEDDNLIVEVEDNGPGMTEAQQARLFQPYHRVDKDRPRMSGLGLGLALSKNLIELHEGRIWVNSIKDKGSTSGCSIPVKGPSSAPGSDTERTE